MDFINISRSIGVVRFTSESITRGPTTRATINITSALRSTGRVLERFYLKHVYTVVRI